ncbi:macrocin-O-methyltransferase [Aureococcus anophagefferens]|nr:macrocin-O-methyltransferase [Aureococcus anophagefferens]
MTNEPEKPFNAKAYGLWSLGCASLLSYRYFMPKSVAGVASPGVVAVKALSLATLLSALGYERRVAAPSPEAEAEWQAIDATIRAAWDAGDWSKFDEGVRASFGLYFKDDGAAAPADDAAGGRPKS